jgi:hypothetical protein
VDGVLCCHRRLVWPRLLTSSPDGSTSLSKIHFATTAWDAICA